MSFFFALSLLLSKSCFMLKLWTIFQKLSVSFYWMLFFSYPIWYVFENFMQITGTFILELKDYLYGDEWRNLVSIKDTILLGIAGTILVLMIMFWFLIFGLFFWSFFKLKKQNKLYCLKDGLRNSKFTSKIFYFSYFMTRILISLAMFLSQTEPVLWIFIALLSFYILIMILDRSPYKNPAENVPHLTVNFVYVITLFVIILSIGWPLYKEYYEGEQEIIAKKVIIVHSSIIGFMVAF